MLKPWIHLPGLALAFLVGLATPRPATADDFLPDPERSIVIAIAAGVLVELDRDARHPVDLSGGRPTAYAPTGLAFALAGGFRFNELIGVEGGYRATRHGADADWGEVAGYDLGHLALRLAWPTSSRQTPVLLLGGAVGSFFFGSASLGGYDDNTALSAGGLAGLAIEHELSLGLTLALRAHYLGLWRRGLTLDLVYSEIEGDEMVDTVVDTKDFDEGFVHLLTVELAFQFEWVLR